MSGGPEYRKSGRGEQVCSCGVPRSEHVLDGREVPCVRLVRAEMERRLADLEVRFHQAIGREITEAVRACTVMETLDAVLAELAGDLRVALRAAEAAGGKAPNPALIGLLERMERRQKAPPVPLVRPGESAEELAARVRSDAMAAGLISQEQYEAPLARFAPRDRGVPFYGPEDRMPLSVQEVRSDQERAAKPPPGIYDPEALPPGAVVRVLHGVHANELGVVEAGVGSRVYLAPAGGSRWAFADLDVADVERLPVDAAAAAQGFTPEACATPVMGAELGECDPVAAARREGEELGARLTGSSPELIESANAALREHAERECPNAELESAFLNATPDPVNADPLLMNAVSAREEESLLGMGSPGQVFGPSCNESEIVRDDEGAS